MKVLTYLLDHPKISQKEIVTLLSVSKTRAKTILSELKQKNLIERSGQGRSTYYTLTRKI